MLEVPGHVVRRRDDLSRRRDDCTKVRRAQRPSGMTKWIVLEARRRTFGATVRPSAQAAVLLPELGKRTRVETVVQRNDERDALAEYGLDAAGTKPVGVHEMNDVRTRGGERSREIPLYGFIPRK